MLPVGWRLESAGRLRPWGGPAFPWVWEAPAALRGLGLCPWDSAWLLPLSPSPPWPPCPCLPRGSACGPPPKSQGGTFSAARSPSVEQVPCQPRGSHRRGRASGPRPCLTRGRRRGGRGSPIPSLHPSRGCDCGEALSSPTTVLCWNVPPPELFLGSSPQGVSCFVAGTWGKLTSLDRRLPLVK